MIRKTSCNWLLAFSIAVVGVWSLGCTKVVDPDDSEVYLPQTEPKNLLRNLETAYKFKRSDRYAELLADDFRFFFDPITRDRDDLPESWNRFTDSTQTNLLFTSSDLIRTKIILTFNPTPIPVNQVGRERWVYIDVIDTFLEVELGVSEEYPEGVTFLVDGQTNRFYFRKGRTEADTLAESETSDWYFITEWVDFGAPL